MRNGDFSAVAFQLFDTQNDFTPYAGNELPIINPVGKYLFAHPEFYPEPNTAAQSPVVQVSFLIGEA